MNKKAITILGAIFLLIVGTLGFLIYQRRSSTNTNTNTATNTQTPPPTPTPTPTPVDPNPTPTPTPTPVPTPTPTPTGNGLTPVQLTNDQVVSPVLFYQGNGMAYFNAQGQLFQAELDTTTAKFSLTNKRELGVPPKSGITKVYWPAAGNNYLVELGSGSTKKWSVYVSDKGLYVDVPSQATAINWMPDGEQLLYLWLDKGKTNLNISPADLSTWQVVTDVWENDDDIAVSPDGRTILFWRTASTDSTNKINMVTPDGKLFRTVVKDGFNTGAVWSPDSQRFAFNRKDSSGKQQLWVANMTTGEVQNMNLAASVTNVAWSPDGRMLYVGLPADSGTGAVVRIDVPTATDRQLTLNGDFEPSQMFTSADGRTLFFKNNLDGGLYYVDVGSVSTAQ